jgi:hypothetical protein
VLIPRPLTRVTRPVEPRGDGPALEDGPDVEGAGAAAAGPTVPRQRRDAYTLYAEIYALRLQQDQAARG